MRGFYPGPDRSFLDARHRPVNELVEDLVARRDQRPHAAFGVWAGRFALDAEALLREKRALPEHGGAQAHDAAALPRRVEHLREFVELHAQCVARARTVGRM